MLANEAIPSLVVWGAAIVNFGALILWWRTLSKSQGVMPILKRNVKADLDFRSFRAKEPELRKIWLNSVEDTVAKTAREYRSFAITPYRSLSRIPLDLLLVESGFLPRDRRSTYPNCKRYGLPPPYQTE